MNRLVAIAALSLVLAPSALATGPPAGGFDAVSTLRGAAATQTLPDPLTDPAAFRDPPNEVRPGTRWWWSGDLVNGPPPFSLSDGLAEVDAMAQAGFGRFEIAWGSDYGNSTEWDNLLAVADEARGKGMTVDMTLGAGWPWSAPATTGDLTQQELMYGRTDVTGPMHFSGAAPAALGDSSPTGTLIAVTAGKVLTAGPTAGVDSPPATSTILDTSSLVDLSANTATDGTVTWDVPAGNWIIFAFWMKNQSGSHVSLLNPASVQAGLQYVQDNQLGTATAHVLPVGGSFFEDSLEYTANELYWTPTFPQEFQSRRGYDMRKYLPLMFDEGVSDYWVPESEPVPDFDLPAGEGARYRHDYYETLTDLYIDNHIKPVSSWALSTYGMRYRSQVAYGNDFETIRSARATVEAGGLADDESLNAGDTPFNLACVSGCRPAAYIDPADPWGRFAMDHYRQIASGSQQAGGLEITSELGAWFGKDVGFDIREYKFLMDKELAAGVTEELLHGYTHSPTGFPWPGQAHFNGLVGESWNYRTYPQWTMFKPLNDYWGRAALVLEQGVARTDVAILRDSFVTTAAGPSTAPKYFFDTSGLDSKGYTVGYVDPVGVAEQAPGPDGSLFPNGPAYKVLVVDGSNVYLDAKGIPGETAAALDQASQLGLRVVFVGDPPSRGLHGRDPAAEDAQVQAAITAIVARPTTRVVATQADVAVAIESLGVRPAAEWSPATQVYTQLRDSGSTRYFFLWNATPSPVSFTGSFRASGAPTEMDLWHGTTQPVIQYRSVGDRTEVPIRLGPRETMALAFRAPAGTSVVSTSADSVVSRGGGQIEVRDAQGGPQTVQFSDGSSRSVPLPVVTDAPITLSGWQLQVDSWGPEGVVPEPALPLLMGLQDWRDIPQLATTSGVGTYTTQVTLPAGWTASDRGATLDVGAFEGGTQVYVNGVRVTGDITPLAPLDVTDLVVPGVNNVKVVLSTTPLNRAIVTPSTSVGRPLFPAEAAQGSQPYGLLGPVKLVPYARGTTSLPGPTAVTVRSFAARRVRGGVALSWRTGSEAGLVGFNVYRGGSRLNRMLVAARGSTASASYRFLDRHPGRARYRLQAVKLDGSRVWVGSASVG